MTATATGLPLSTLWTAGAVHELRALQVDGRPNLTSGYFDAPEALADAATGLVARTGSIYWTVNPVNPALLARSANAVQSYVKTTTSDRDIARRLWLPIDLDPVRPAGIPSTDAEHDAAGVRAAAIRDELAARGWPAPALMDSGNGHYVLYRVDLPNDDAARDLVQACLAALGEEFGDDVVEVDSTTGNAARILRVPGTVNRKGSGSPDRPHRPATLWRAASDVVPVELLEALAASSRPASAAATSPAATPPDAFASALDVPAFDLARFVEAYLPGAKGPKAKAGGEELWELDVCPWNDEHNRGEAYVGQFPSGALYAGCHHDSCDWTWPDLRQMFDPKPPRQDPAPGVPAGAPGPGPTSTASDVQTVTPGRPWDKYLPTGPGTRMVPYPAWDDADLLALRVWEKRIALAAQDEAARLHRDSTGETHEQRVSRLMAATLSSEDLDDLPPQEWLVDNWLPAGGLCMIVGASGCYKSFVAVDLAVRVVLGVPWFGWQVRQGPVVYVAAEGSTGLKSRIREAEVARGADRPLRDLSVVPMPVQIGGEDWAAFAEVIRLRKAALVVVDTLNRSTVGVEENSNSEMRDVADAAAELARQTGATVVLVHHAGHEGSRSRGASAIPAAADAIIAVRRSADLRLTVSTRKADGGKVKDCEEQTANLKVTPGPLGLSLVVANLDGADPFEPARKSCREGVLALFEYYLQVLDPGKRTTGLTQAEVLRGLRKGSAELVQEVDKVGWSPAGIKKELHTLVANGVLLPVSGSSRSYVVSAGGPE